MTEPVSVRDHLEALLHEQDRRLNERWQAQQQALEVATTQLEKRLTLLNDLRENVLTRDEYNSHHETLMLKVEGIDDRVGRIENISRGLDVARSRAFGTIGTVVAVLTVLVILADHFLK